VLLADSLDEATRQNPFRKAVANSLPRANVRSMGAGHKHPGIGWFNMKQVMLLIGGAWTFFRSLRRSRQAAVVLAGLFVLLVSTLEPVPEGASGSGSRSSSTEPPPTPKSLADELGIVIERGTTPDLVGLTALQVVAVIEELKERPTSLRGWPRGVSPSDDVFELEGTKYLVCRQSVEPGSRYSASMTLDFRESCNYWLVVPNLVGLSDRAAELEGRERNVRVVGTTSRDRDDFYVCDQDVQPGTQFTGSGFERVRVTVRANCAEYAAELEDRAARQAQLEQEARERAERQAMLGDPNTTDGRKVFLNQTSESLQAIEAGAAQARRDIRAGRFLTSFFDELFGRTGYSVVISSFSELREQGPDDVQARWGEWYGSVKVAYDAVDKAVDDWSDDILSDRELDPYFVELERQARQARSFIESLR